MRIGREGTAAGFCDGSHGEGEGEGEVGQGRARQDGEDKGREGERVEDGRGGGQLEQDGL